MHQSARDSLSSLGLHIISEVVLSTLLLEEVELLHGLKSVGSKGKPSILSHTEGLHVLFNLDVIEDEGSNVVSVFLGESSLGGTVGFSLVPLGQVLDSITKILESLSGVVVSSFLGV